MIEPLQGVARDIFQLLSTHQKILRSEIAEQLGISASTISTHLGALLSQGLVEEIDVSTSMRGRPSKYLRVSTKNMAILTVNVTYDYAQVATVDLRGHIRKEINIFEPVKWDPEDILREAMQQITKADPLATLISCGIAINGPVENSLVLQCGLLPRWEGFNGKEVMERLFGLPCVVHNDVNCAAVFQHARWKKSAALAKPASTIMVHLTTGLGAGIVLNDKLFVGESGGAGEMSHARLGLRKKRLCHCGKWDCLEMSVSEGALVRDGQAINQKVTDVTALLELIRCGDRELLELVLERGEVIGEAVSVLTNVINPNAIILTGAMFSIEAFTAAVRAKVFEYCHPMLTRNLQVVRPSDEKYQIIYGIASLASPGLQIAK